MHKNSKTDSYLVMENGKMSLLELQQMSLLTGKQNFRCLALHLKLEILLHSDLACWQTIFIICWVAIRNGQIG